jgi:hypothetical protein
MCDGWPGYPALFARPWQDFTSSLVIVITVLQLFGAYNGALFNNTIFSLCNLLRQIINRTVSQIINIILFKIFIQNMSKCAKETWLNLHCE